MKNNLKRIAIILPVIALLLAFLAVPAAAEAIDGGYVEPVTFDDCLYRIDGASSNSYIDITLGDLVSFGSLGPYEFTHYLVIDVSSLSGLIIRVSNDYPVVLKRNDDSWVASMLYINNASVSFDYFSSTAGINIGLVESDSFEILCTDDLLPFLVDVDYTYYTLDPGPVEKIGNVWTGIMTWITSALTTVMGAFYVDGSLTLLGTLACIGVSVGIGFLLIGLIQQFLKLRG